ncbi:hypothetical protein [Paenimyroides baculatum]|uniref:Uncharacterized protein n=1 Tax=Paenimyroides baculatum TaxID=2608000 RepID=A0A5M6CL03_9FLAO|nr:hypothetical protein [Paenimyroides baculatum]KAA5535881.1 hypothetical protein F0460_05435 [Paenimyroides baculatum]
MSFTGYWSDRILFWIWIAVTPFIIILYWKKLVTKLYFGFLILCLILSILPMGILFFGIILSGTGSGRLNHFNLENNIRIQTVAYGVMGRPRVQIVKDGFLFDKIKLEDQDEIEKNDSTWLEVRDAINAQLVKETDTSITVKYFFENDTLQTVHEFQEKTSLNY